MNLRHSTLLVALLFTGSALGQIFTDSEGQPIKNGHTNFTVLKIPPVPEIYYIPKPAVPPVDDLSNALAPIPVKHEIRPIPGGATADFGLSTVVWPTEITAQQGISLTTRDGRPLVFRPAFLVLADRVTGTNHLLADLTNAVGKIISDTEVTYPNAFESEAITADLRYEYDPHRDSLEQYVTLRGNFAIPEGLDSKNLRLECWTEWLQGEPQEIKRSALTMREADRSVPAVEDENIEISFGVSKIVARGRAFSVGAEDAAIPVSKSWAQIPVSNEESGNEKTVDRRFLIEAVDYLAAKPRLEKLGKAKGQASFRTSPTRSLWASALPSYRARLGDKTLPMARSQTGALAASGGADTGFVIDFCAQSCIAAPYGLVSWWDAENTQNRYLDVQGVNPGTPYSMTTQSGQIGTALYFNGTGAYVSVADSTSLNFGDSGSFSIECWINAETATTDGDIQTIVDKRNAPSDTIATGYALYLINGCLGFRLGNATDPFQSFDTSSPDLRGGWHHIGVTVNRTAGDGIKFYVDGVNIATMNPTSLTGSIDNTQPFLIGKHARSGVNAGFKGMIDELSIYNRVLILADITAIKNANQSGKCGQCIPCGTCATPLTSALVGWWTGDSTPADRVGSNPMVLQGTTTYANSVVDAAFSFDGAGYAYAPASSALDVGPGSGFTIEAWVTPMSIAMQPLFEWYNDPTGAHLWANFTTEGQTPGALFANLVDTSGGSHYLQATYALTVGNATHIALTYDRTSGIGRLFANGNIVKDGNLGSFVPKTAFPFYLGCRPPNYRFNGKIDEPALYNRALSASEVQAIYNAGSNGKCKTSAGTIAEALDQPSWSFTTSGSPDWFFQTATTHDQSDAAQSGAITHSQATYFQTTVNGPGTISFYWKVNSEAGYDFLRFFIDGAQQAQLSGNIDWNQGSFAISSGSHTLKWQYSKDPSVNTGADAGWVDDVRFLAGGTAPTITTQPQSQTVAVGNSATFSVGASGSAPFTYQWAFNGSAISGATLSSYTINPVQTTHAGSYAVTVANSYGSTASSAATLTVSASTCYPPPSGIVGWWSGDSTGADLVNGNTAALQNGATYAQAKVGYGFSLDGSGAHAVVTANSSINVGPGPGLTLEAWVKRMDNSQRPLFEFSSASVCGTHMWVNYPSAGGLYVNLTDTSGINHPIQAANVVPSQTLTHVAVTYDRSSGVAKLIVNGVVQTTSTLGVFTPRTSDNFYMGYRPLYGFEKFNGVIDEPSLYNCALTDAAVLAIYQAGTSGKCRPAPILPTLSFQQTSGLVNENSSTPAILSVLRSGNLSSSVAVSFSSTGSATVNSDYTVAPNPFVIPAGQSSGSLAITPVSDSLDESDELAVITLAPQSSYQIGSPSSAVITIRDKPTISVEATTATTHEASGTPGVFTIRREATDVSANLQVYFQLTGVATEGTDYSSISKPVTIPAGANSTTVNIAALADSAQEISESVILTVIARPEYNLGVSSSAQLAIQDAVIINSEPIDQTILVAGSGFTDAVTFSISATGVEPLTYQWIYTDPYNSSVEIEGATSPSFTIPCANAEDEGRYSVRITGAAGAGSITSRQAILTVASGSGYALMLTGTRQDYTLKTGMTYLIDSEVHFVGSSTIEGGAVIKYRKNSAAKLVFDGPVACQTGPYSPAIFTCEDDDGAGWVIDDSPGGGVPTGYYAGVALDLASATGTLLHDLRVCYATTGIRYRGPVTAEVTDHVRHIQIVKCSTGFRSEGNTSSSPNRARVLNLGNVLIYGSQQAISGSYFRGRAEHLTVSGCADKLIVDDASSGLGFEFVNSLFVSVASLGQGLNLADSHHNGFHPSTAAQFGITTVTDSEIAPFAPTIYEEPAGSGEWYVFPENGQGRFYLREGSPFVDFGDPGIDSALKADLAKRTTAAPSDLFSDDINTSQTIGPEALRDLDIPDLGWHYAAVDYVVNGATVNNATLNIDQGTVLAMVGAFYDWGIRLNAGGRLNVNGVPTNRVIFARLEAVQESPLRILSTYGPTLHFRTVFFGSRDIPVTPLAEASILYADFPTLSAVDPPLHIAPLTFEVPDRAKHACISRLKLEGCWFQGGSLLYEAGGIVNRAVTIRNCIFDRADFWLWNGSYEEYTHVAPIDAQVSAANNVFFDSNLAFLPGSGNPDWTFTDNIFDHCNYHASGSRTFNGPIPANHHNAYVGMIGNHLSPVQNAASDPDLPSLVYETGPLGRYYLPQTSSQLINQGSRTAGAAGLYHFTTATAITTKEAGSHVDIGPHYLGINGGAGAMDSNSDGIPDFIADNNGDGNEFSETPWQTANSGSLRVLSPVTGAGANGRVRVSLGLGPDAVDITYIEIIVDADQRVPGATIDHPADSTAELVLDTTLLSNGEHSLRLRAVHGGSIDGNSSGHGEQSPSIALNVDNEIRFPNWQDQTEYTIRVDAQADLASATCAVWVFDSSYCKSPAPEGMLCSGTVVDGRVSFSMTQDELGLQPASEDPASYSVIEYSASGAEKAVVTPRKLRNTPFPPLGLWAVAYQDDSTEVYFDKTAKRYKPLMDFADSTSLGLYYVRDVLLGYWRECARVSADGQGPLYAAPGGTAQTWPVRSSEGKSRYRKDRNLLLDYLGKWTEYGDVRNFFGQGHGSVVGDDSPAGHAPGAIGFMDIPVSKIEKATRGRRFRFVFLHGCESVTLLTAFGADRQVELPHGFPGEPDAHDGSPVGLSAYSRDLRPGAFLGWNEEVPFGVDLSQPTVDYRGRTCEKKAHRAAFFLAGQIANNWKLGFAGSGGPVPLWRAVDQAITDTRSVFPSEVGSYPAALRHHGYRDLMCVGPDSFNHAGDWPR